VTAPEAPREPERRQDVALGGAHFAMMACARSGREAEHDLSQGYGGRFVAPCTRFALAGLGSYDARRMASPPVDKPALIAALLTALRAELAQAERAAREAAEAANHPEAKPETDKDTRKIELSYLAAGQAARARELEAAIALVQALPLTAREPQAPVAAGAVVTLDVAGKPQRVIVSPAGGGLKLEAPGGPISVVTPQSPLGSSLLGKSTGESFELSVAGRKSEVEIVAVE
jgi:transcription elongation GreA/GreB family factor